MSKLLRKPWLWLVLGVCLAFIALVYPVLVIQPFRRQGPRELALALTVLRIRFPLEIVLAVAVLLLSVFVWRHSRRVAPKVIAVLLTLLACGCAVASRINIYEIMFHPLEQPRFIAAGQSKLDGREEVIAVKLSGSARAYPIRVISYHHVVNDVVAGEPIVATY